MLLKKDKNRWRNLARSESCGLLTPPWPCYLGKRCLTFEEGLDEVWAIWKDLASVKTKSLGRVIPGIWRISKAGFSFAIGLWKEWNTYGNMGLHNNKGTKVKRWNGIDGGRLEDSAMYAETMRVKERRLLFRKEKESDINPTPVVVVSLNPIQRSRHFSSWKTTQLA